MRKNNALYIILFCVIISLVSCRVANDKIDNSQDGLENIPTLNPVHSITSINEDMMIQKPYDKDLSERVSLIFHNAEYTILCYSSSLNEYGYRSFIIRYKQGIIDGKIIFEEHTRSNEYSVGLMNYDFSLHTEAIYSDIEFAGKNQAIIKSDDGYGVLDFKNGVLIPCEFKHKPILINNYIVVPVDETRFEETYFIHNRSDGKFLYLLEKKYSETESNEYIIVKSNGQEENITDISQYIPDTLTLLPFKDKKTGYYGYKNKFNDIVIDSLYLYADIFHENRARVLLGNKWGFINTDGGLVISCIYDEVSSFNNGIARVVYDNQRIFIDVEGKTVEYFDYFIIKQFSEGLAPAILKQDDHWKYVNEYGDVAFNGFYSKAGEFSHGLAPVMSVNPVVYGPGKNYYYIDTEGVPVFGPLIFHEAYKLNEEGYGFAWSMGSEQRFNENTGSDYSVTAYKYYVIISRTN